MSLRLDPPLDWHRLREAFCTFLHREIGGFGAFNQHNTDSHQPRLSTDCGKKCTINSQFVPTIKTYKAGLLEPRVGEHEEPNLSSALLALLCTCLELGVAIVH